MVCEACSFETKRLRVAEWHAGGQPLTGEFDLAQAIGSMLTASVTSALPGDWQGAYSLARAATWIEERDREGPTLLVVERSSETPVGLLVLFELPAESGVGVDVRVGYLVRESAWGRGFGSEFVSGFVSWCQTTPEVRSLAGGVAADNRASIRILEACGFRRLPDGPGAASGERLYELRFDRGPRRM